MGETNAGDRGKRRLNSAWRRPLLRLVRAAALVYLGLCILAYFAQNWLLFPAHSDQGSADAQVHPSPDMTLLALHTHDGTPIAAVFGRALMPDGRPDPDAVRRPIILYFYGNGGAVAWSWNEFDLFRRLGANVLIPDFAGYGMSGGKPGEASLYATADAAYDWLLSCHDLDRSKIIVVGWSLGAAVAIDLASRRQIAGLAIFNAFTTLRAMAHQLLPWLPTGHLVSYQFDNIGKMRSISCPTLICHGAMDTQIPPAMSGELADAAGGQVTRLTLPSADHATIFTADRSILRPALQRFVDKIASQPSH